MTAELAAIRVVSAAPELLAGFWAAVLGREVAGRSVLPARDGKEVTIRFVAGEAPKTRPNYGHFDLTSTDLDDQRRTVQRALAHGGRHLDIGQGPEVTHVVLADPDGNEFCVIEPGNNFLAGCGAIGALSCDGSRAAGRFWSAALGWPLVWDRDEETAVQSPRGGTKLTWGGPPTPRWTSRERVGFEVAGEEQPLVALGATPLRPGVLADPDGKEFHLV